MNQVVDLEDPNEPDFHASPEDFIVGNLTSLACVKKFFVN